MKAPQRLSDSGKQVLPDSVSGSVAGVSVVGGIVVISIYLAIEDGREDSRREDM